MRKIKASTLRLLSVLAFVALVLVGLALHTGFGTMSSFGIESISTLCPLGALEAAIASRTVVPPMLIGVAIVIALTVIFGRFFCAWGCPIPLVRRILGRPEFEQDGVKHPKKDKKSKQNADAGSSAGALDIAAEGQIAGVGQEASNSKRGGLRRFLDIPSKDRGGLGDSRNWVLGGAVLSTAVLGFPVFCLVCPVGLTFGTIIVFWRLFGFAEVSWSLLVYPAILAVELVVLRKWCHRFCPLGALFSLIARANKTFKPVSDESACLKSKGAACDKCAEACPEGIDLHDCGASAPLNECIKCRSCAEACPVSAISFPAFKKKVQELAPAGTRESEGQ